MSIEMISVLMAVSFVGLLVIGLPLAFAAGAIAVIFALVLYGPPGLVLVVSRVFTLLGNSVLVAVPLFVFMACLLERSGHRRGHLQRGDGLGRQRARRPGGCGHHHQHADGGDGRACSAPKW